ncbi:unnamed protein product [Parajaminaea phylloscopi]
MIRASQIASSSRVGRPLAPAKRMVSLRFTTQASLRQQIQSPQPQSSSNEGFERPGRPRGPPSRHSLFYREFYPPLLRCLAYGSSIYFALHLAWSYLDGEEQRYLEEQHTSSLQRSIKEARTSALRTEDATDSRAASARSGDGAGQSSSPQNRAWWKSWA